MKYLVISAAATLGVNNPRILLVGLYGNQFCVLLFGA